MKNLYLYIVVFVVSIFFLIAFFAFYIGQYIPAIIIILSTTGTAITLLKRDKQKKMW